MLPPLNRVMRGYDTLHASRSVRVWQPWHDRTPVCCRAMLFVLMATTVSDQGFRGGLIKIVFQASSGLRISVSLQPVCPVLPTALGTASFSWRPRRDGFFIPGHPGSVIPTTAGSSPEDGPLFSGPPGLRSGIKMRGRQLKPAGDDAF